MATFIQSHLSPIQKLLHHRQMSKREAFDIVSKVSLKDAGLDIAWHKLFTRFPNKRALVTAVIRKFLNFLQSLMSVQNPL